jgi:hypothetical protein
VSLLLLFAGGEAAPPPPEPSTDLQVYGLPGGVFEAFPSRSPLVTISLDAVSLAWTGQNLNAPVTISLEAADLRWIGRNIPELFSITDLQVYGLPGPPLGPFPLRAPVTVISLDAFSMSFGGQDVVAPGDTMEPANMTWSGQALLILEREPITDLGPTGKWPGPSYATMPRRDGVTLLATGAFTWDGRELVVADLVSCDAMSLAWTGQNIPLPSGRLILDLRGLTPLTGVR